VRHQVMLNGPVGRRGRDRPRQPELIERIEQLDRAGLQREARVSANSQNCSVQDTRNSSTGNAA